MFQLSQDFSGVSVSHGTMRQLDILQAIHDFLINHAPSQYPDELQQDATEFLLILTKKDNGESVEIDDNFYYRVCDFTNESLWGIMESIAPKNHYFGAHIGDGTDYGFWTHDECWQY